MVAEKVPAVGHELDQAELEDKATIQASPSFKAAMNRYRGTITLDGPCGILHLHGHMGK